MPAMTRLALGAVVLLLAAVVGPAVGQPYGPRCPSYADPYCCSGTWENGRCGCWGDQVFGQYCNFDCRRDLCNGRGICNANSHAFANKTFIAGLCVCDGAYEGDRCQAVRANPTCSDNWKNGHETDVDCGGPACRKCLDGQRCDMDSDCRSVSCNNGYCFSSSCADHVKNGDETDVDCGGVCAPCASTRGCNEDVDCFSGNCVSGTCVADNDPPLWVAGYPSIRFVTETQVSAWTQLNEPGTVYWTVVPRASAATPPTAAQLVARTAPGAIISGSVLGPTPNVNIPILVQHIFTPDTDYTAFFVAQDDVRPSPNVQPAASRLDFHTAPYDVFAPYFWLDTPKLVRVLDTRVNMQVALNEPGTVFVRIVTVASAEVPNAAQVIATPSYTYRVTSLWGTEQFTVPGLVKSTDYVAYLVAQDTASTPNVQATPVSITFRTTDDVTPPLFASGYPRLNGIGPDAVTVVVNLNELGWAYSLCQRFTDPMPTPEQIITGTGQSGAVVYDSQRAMVSVTNSELFMALQQLPSATQLTVWVLGVDTLTNTQEYGSRVDFATAADVNPPIFNVPFPSVTSAKSRSVILAGQLNERGRIFAIVTPEQNAAPASADIKAGTYPQQLSWGYVDVKKGVTGTFTLYHLLPNTTYRAWVVAQDFGANPNLQQVPRYLQFKTSLDFEAPEVIGDFPKVLDIKPDQATLYVEMSEPCNVYAVVDLATATAPQAADVRAGHGAAGSTPVFAGIINVNRAVTNGTLLLPNLLPSTRYVVYMLGEDRQSPPNMQYVVTSVAFATPRETRPPGMLSGSPSIVNITSVSAVLVVTLDQRATVYAVVAASTSSRRLAVPDSTEVKANPTLIMTVTTPRTPTAASIRNLHPATNYNVYVATENSFGALSPVYSTSFATAAASCTNGIKDGDETDVDCGHACPTGCGASKVCAVNADCSSKICRSGSCTGATCADGVQNGDESDIDCGGSCPQKCPDAKACNRGSDCQSLVCKSSKCAAPTCSDSVKNAFESDVDCGGQFCSKCADGHACTTDTDCGGGDCANGVCGQICVNGVKDGSESDIDCGGTCTTKCATGKICVVGSDCASKVCTNGLCVAPTCTDTVANGDEADADCGGSCPNKCAADKACTASSDCATRVCDLTMHKCVASCTDGVKNGNEADVDCGGSCTAKCGLGKICLSAADCASQECGANSTCVSTCRQCHATELQIASCTPTVAAVCKVKTPTYAVSGANGTVVTVSTSTSGAYLMLTRDGSEPACDTSASRVNLLTALPYVSVVRTVNTSVTLNSTSSVYVVAVGCKDGVQTSNAAAHVIYVPGSPVKFCSQYALYPLAFEEFSDQKRSGFLLSVAESIGVPVSSVSIYSAEAGTSLDTTIVTYCVAVVASPAATTTGHRLAAVRADVGGVTKSTNGTLHTALVRNLVLAAGGSSAQATGPSTGVIPGLGSDSALYAALIVACIVLLCCIIGACCWWRNREKRYRRVSSKAMAVIPETPPETPTGSVSGNLEADPEPEQDELTSAPLTKRTANSMRTGAPRAPLAGVPTPLSTTPEPTLVQPTDYAKSGVIDLSEYMREAEDISTTIEKKGTPLFQVRPAQRVSRR